MSSTDDPPVSSLHLPRHLSIETGTRVFYCCSCIVSFLLLGCFVLRLLQHRQYLTWYAVAALPMGMLCADFCQDWCTGVQIPGQCLDADSGAETAASFSSPSCQSG